MDRVKLCWYSEYMLDNPILANLYWQSKSMLAMLAERTRAEGTNLYRESLFERN